MFTSVAQKLKTLQFTQPPEMIRALTQLANCAAGLDHRGALEVDVDGYWHTTNTGEQFPGFSDPALGAGNLNNPGLPLAGAALVNPAAVANVVDNGVLIQNGAGATTQGVWFARPSPAQADQPGAPQIAVVVPGAVVLNNLVMRGNIVNLQGNFNIIANVNVWIANASGNITPIGDDPSFILYDNYSAPRTVGCLDTYSVDCATGSRPFTLTDDIVDLTNDFTFAIRLKPIFASPPTNAFGTVLTYRESSGPKAVRLHFQIYNDGGIYKLQYTFGTVPSSISPSSVGPSARVGRWYESGTCLAVFMRWNQSSKLMTLNVLRPGDTGGSDTNDEYTWDVSYGTYILNGGADKYLYIQGEDSPVGLFYWDRFAVWKRRLSDGEVTYDFSY